MNDLNAKLGPGTLADPSCSPYSIPLSTWEDVNSYVKQIADVTPAITDVLASYVPVFPELHACAVRWQERTFPDMIVLSRSIYDYGTVTVVTQYNQLKIIVDKLDNGQNSQMFKEEFNQIMEQLQTKLSENEDLAEPISKDTVRFVKAIETAKHQLVQKGSTSSYRAMLDFNPYDETQKIAQMLSKLPALIQSLQRSPLSSLQYIRGSWISIQEDLQEIQETYSDNFDVDNPFLTTLGIDLAEEEWRQVADEANGFASQVWSLP